jgi:hypothetical protein
MAARETTKVCTKCSQSKPLTDYYSHPSTADRHSPVCKKCDSARGRKTTGPKINRQRARHRAIAILVQRHEDEFRDLMDLQLAEVAEEAEALAADPQAKKHYKDEPVRLRPGKRMPGEKAGDRIDVARCPHCIKHHDRGHVCTRCGAAPAATLRLPDDGHLDEIAVERAMHGDPVRLTEPERVEAVRRLAARGLSDSAIGRLLHCSDRTVLRWRQSHGVEATA